MTIQSETNRVTYPCNGVLTDFSFDFKIFSEDDIKVTITDSGGMATVLTITTDYTVAGENGKYESGGTVSTVKGVDGTMGAYAWATGYSITIELDLDIEQETDLVYGGTYSTQTIELMVDRLTKICQQLDDAINRSVVLSTASELSGLTIPDLVAGRYLYAADEETLGWAVSIDTTALTVSDWAKTLLDDVNAAAALGTLGLSAFIKTLIDDATAYAARKTLQTPLHSVVAAKTAAYEVLPADDGKLILADATAINIAITLPAVGDVWNGFTVGIKKVDSSANYVESTPDGAETIDGAASYILYKQGDTAFIVCDGTGWRVGVTALTNLTVKRLLVGAGNGSLTPMAAMTDGQLVVGQTNGSPLPKTLSGHVSSISAAGSVALIAITGAMMESGTVAEANMASSAISQGKLKTTTGEVSVSVGASSNALTASLPGGEYAFRFKVKSSSAGTNDIAFMGLRSVALHTSYVAPGAYFTNASGDTAYTAYALERYVTSSGELHWVFIQRDKTTLAVKRTWQSPEHPCFGMGGNPDTVPIPIFPKEDNAEIVSIILSAEEADEIIKKTSSSKAFIEVMDEEYEIDEKSYPEWPTKPVTVGLPDTVTIKGKIVRVDDWTRMPVGTPVNPIKLSIPKPDNVTLKSLRKKS